VGTSSGSAERLADRAPGPSLPWLEKQPYGGQGGGGHSASGWVGKAHEPGKLEQLRGLRESQKMSRYSHKRDIFAAAAPHGNGFALP